MITYWYIWIIYIYIYYGYSPRKNHQKNLNIPSPAQDSRVGSRLAGGISAQMNSAKMNSLVRPEQMVKSLGSDLLGALWLYIYICNKCNICHIYIWLYIYGYIWLYIWLYMTTYGTKLGSELFFSNNYVDRCNNRPAIPAWHGRASCLANLRWTISKKHLIYSDPQEDRHTYIYMYQ